MAIDLQKAREIIGKSERWNLDDKLENAFDEPLGEIFWTLHRAGVLDCSTDHNWWNEMEEVTELYTAEDAANLLLQASAHPGMGGLVDDSDRRSGLAWNIYCHCFVENKKDDPAPLVAGFHRAPEPMKSAWGLDMASMGLIEAAELPDDTIERVGPTAVREVGGQRWYERLAEVFDDADYGPALMRHAATPGFRIWSLDFLTTCAPHGSPEDWAGLALNIDYADTVPKMLAWLDRSAPDGTVEALEGMLRDGRTDPDPTGEAARTRQILGQTLDGDFGVAVACIYAGRQARARGERLGPVFATALLEALERKHDTWKHLAEVFDLIDRDEAEAYILTALGGYWVPWELAEAVPTAKAAAALVAKVADYKQRDVNRPPAAMAPSLASLARAHPEPFVAALSGKKKLPAREFLARALADGTDSGAIDVLFKLLGDSKDVVREAALDGLVARGAHEALTKASASRKAAVKAAGEEGLQRLRPREAKTADELSPSESRETVTEAQHDAFEKLWRWRRWAKRPLAERIDELAESLDGADLLTVVYDGLYKVGGTTTSKLAWWHEVVGRYPADARTCRFDVEMLCGWPLVITEGFDDSPARHRAAIEDAWARLARYGEHVRPAVEAVLDSEERSGLDAAWRYALDQGWSGLAARVHGMARDPARADLRLVMALDTLGDDAHAGLAAALSDKKADVRWAAASAITQRPSAALAPLVHRKDRAGKVRDQLARAGFAIDGLDRPPLADDPDLDDRLARFPGDAPKGCDPAKLPRPWWADGAELSVGALGWLLNRLAAESPEVEDADLRAVSERLDKATTSPLYQAIVGATRDRWAFFAAAHLATDAEMHALGPDLDDEARGGGSAKAFYKVEAMRRHGSPAALTWLDHWARNARSQGLQARAELALEAAAEARATTPDAIADEIVQDFGLDAAGTRVFPYGSRSMKLRLAVDGSVGIERPDGKVVKSLPKALASDDAEQVKAHRAAIRGFRKQLGAALVAAVERLEQAMVAGRRWDRALFERTWGSSALLGVLAREVWWAGFGDRVVPLRFADGALHTEGGTPWDWEAPVGVLHPLELDETTRAALGHRRAPFRQLDRRTAELRGDEPASRQITRFEDEEVATAMLRRVLERRRWRRGTPQDGGGVRWFTKHFPRADLTAQIELDPGFSIGAYDDGPSLQKVPRVIFEPGRHGRDGLPYRARGVRLAEVDPIVVSEVLTDLQAIAGQPPA